MGVLSVLLYSAVLAGLLAYVLHDPVPEGADQNTMVWSTLGAIKLFNYISRGLGLLGFNEPVLNRKLMATFNSMAATEHDPQISETRLVFEQVPVVLYSPVNLKGPTKTVVFYHGGGWTFGNADTYANHMIGLSKALQAVVVYVEYRLAPEHPFPAAVDDCEVATLHLIENAHKYNVDPARIALVGDSAGGTLVTVVARHMRDNAVEPMPKIQVMIYPVTQAVNFDTPSYRANQNGPFLSKSYMVMYIASYLFGGSYGTYWDDMYNDRHTSAVIKKSNAKTYTSLDALPDDEFKQGYKPSLDHGDQHLWSKINKKLTNPDFSPLYAKDLSGLPPAFVSTCQNDVLRDDGYFYVQRLRAAGVEVTHRNIPACYHGWIWHRNFSPKYDNEYQKIVRYIKEKL